ncbi:MAG TPA: 50S ribosomal protein L15 [Deltaproteobacteria bacterium]|nr:MAG: 50S ribosomal protein L15 [Deltaproteobacteria bacterium GWC2_65_14]HBO70120.1 50S ribosomal protein L15 [Deltaproteobacteria bacterium]
MKLSDLRPAKGARTARKRVGRGKGSGLGKTSGRGSKGLRARSGGGTPPGYEGGQMPLQRRLPKRGFRNIFRKEFAIVQVKDLNRFEAGTTVDVPALRAAGLVKNVRDGVKLLASGEVDRPLNVKVDRASQAAARKVEAAGGTLEVTPSC